jgi:hypothetical protein
VQISLGRLDLCMPEPQGDLADISGGLQDHHRCRVSVMPRAALAA